MNRLRLNVFTEHLVMFSHTPAYRPSAHSSHCGTWAVPLPGPEQHCAAPVGPLASVCNHKSRTGGCAAFPGSGHCQHKGRSVFHPRHLQLHLFELSAHVNGPSPHSAFMCPGGAIAGRRQIPATTRTNAHTHTGGGGVLACALFDCWRLKHMPYTWTIGLKAEVLHVFTFMKLQIRPGPYLANNIQSQFKLIII